MQPNFIKRLLSAVFLCSAASVAACAGDTTEVGEDQNVTAVTNARVEIFVGQDGQFYFRVIAGNGEKLLRSEGYTTRAAAEKGILGAKQTGLASQSYKLAKSVNGQWFFNLVAKNGKTIGTSETYVSKSHAERGLQTLQKIFVSLQQEKPKVVCFMKNLPVVPQGKAQVEIDFSHLPEGEWGYSDSLDAWKGSYSFSAGIEDGAVQIVFQENEHVQDEIGSTACDLPKPLKRGTTFCNEPLEIDTSLGTEDDEKVVHAFDFACRVD
jgi:uncharacterized protein